MLGVTVVVVLVPGVMVSGSARGQEIAPCPGAQHGTCSGECSRSARGRLHEASSRCSLRGTDVLGERHVGECSGTSSTRQTRGHRIRECSRGALERRRARGRLREACSGSASRGVLGLHHGEAPLLSARGSLHGKCSWDALHVRECSRLSPLAVLGVVLPWPCSGSPSVVVLILAASSPSTPKCSGADRAFA